MLHVACSIISYIDVARYEAQLMKFSFVCFNEMIRGKGVQGGKHKDKHRRGELNQQLCRITFMLCKCSIKIPSNL